MRIEFPIQNYALYHNIQEFVIPQGNLFLMLLTCSRNISAGLVNLDGTLSIILIRKTSN